MAFCSICNKKLSWTEGYSDEGKRFCENCWNKKTGKQEEKEEQIPEFIHPPDIHLNWISIHDKKPTIENKNYIYNLGYTCTINNDKKLGGFVKEKLISPVKLDEKEIADFANNQPSFCILPTITLNNNILSDEINQAIHFFNTNAIKTGLSGKLKIKYEKKWLDLKEFINASSHLELNTIVKGEINYSDKTSGKKIKILTETIYKNFKILDLEKLEI